jgi:hypothetical protein
VRQCWSSLVALILISFASIISLARLLPSRVRLSLVPRNTKNIRLFSMAVQGLVHSFTTPVTGQDSADSRIEQNNMAVLRWGENAEKCTIVCFGFI